MGRAADYSAVRARSPTAPAVLGAAAVPLYLSVGFALQLALLALAGLGFLLAASWKCLQARRIESPWLPLMLAAPAPAVARALDASGGWPLSPSSKYTLICATGLALIAFAAAARSLPAVTRGGGFVDAAVLTAAIGSLLWIFVFAPAERDQAISSAATFGVVTFAVLELGLLLGVGTLAFGLVRNDLGERLLTAAGVSILLGGALGESLALHTHVRFAPLIYAGWPLGLGLLAGAALSPERRGAETYEARAPIARRLTVLALSLLAAPLGLVIESLAGEPISVFPLALGAMVVTIFGCAQVVAIARSHESLRTRADNSRRRFRELAERLRPVVIETEFGADRPIFVSRSAEAVFGYPRERWLESGEFWSSLIDPEDRELVLAAYRDALAAEEESFSLEYRMRTAGGQTIWIRHLASLRTDQASGRRVYSAILDDVSEHRLDREELERSLGLLRATLDVTADGILVIDGEGGIAGFNRRFVEMWNIPESVLASGSGGDALVYLLDQLVDPTGFLVGMEKLNVDPESVSLDLIDFKDGRCFERYSCPRRSGAAIVGRVWSFRDVTVRVRAEEALRESERSFRETLENMSLLALALDADGVVTFCNDHLLAVTGYSREELLGKHWFALAYPGDAQAERHFSEELADDSPAWHSETVISTRKGDRRTVSWSATTLRDRRGACAGIVAIGEDVTGARNAEESLRRNQEHLYQAQKMEAVGRLAGGVAHDFNNLLTAISGYSEFLVGQLPLDSILRHDAEEIQRAGGTGGRAHAPAARLQPAPGAAAQGDRPERGRRGDGGDAAPADRRGRRAGDRFRSGAEPRCAPIEASSSRCSSTWR